MEFYETCILQDCAIVPSTKVCCRIAPEYMPSWKRELISEDQFAIDSARRLGGRSMLRAQPTSKGQGDCIKSCIWRVPILHVKSSCYRHPLSDSLMSHYFAYEPLLCLEKLLDCRSQEDERIWESSTGRIANWYQANQGLAEETQERSCACQNWGEIKSSLDDYFLKPTANI